MDTEMTRRLCGVFGCEAEELRLVREIEGGLTNRSFVVSYAGADYVYRAPGGGPEKRLDRFKEARALALAREAGLDTSFLLAVPEEGWKLSRYVPVFREPDYRSRADTERVAAALQRLHALPGMTERGLDPWEDGQKLIKELQTLDRACLAAFEELCALADALRGQLAGDGVAPCFTHGDSYRNNWMLTPEGGTLLIDWEYAGLADPGVDYGYYMLDADYSPAEAADFLRIALGETDSPALRRHHLIYLVLTGLYWSLWAQHRLLFGAPTKAYRDRWRASALRWARQLSDSV